MEGFESAINSNIRQPRVELPLSIDKIVDVDCVILTHYHPDHIDEFALRALRKDIPFFVQNECDMKLISSFGFSDVRVLESETIFRGIKLNKTNCQHGKREIIKPICDKIGMPYDAMGVVFSEKSEKTLYLAGDTILCDEVKCALSEYNPDIIIVNACGATVLNGERIIMNGDDVKELANNYKDLTIIASHLDTVSHLTTTREDIKNLNLKNVLAPLDNEILEL